MFLSSRRLSHTAASCLSTLSRSLSHSGGGWCPKMLPRCRRAHGSWSSTPCRGRTAPTCSSLPPTPFSTTRPPSFTVRHSNVALLMSVECYLKFSHSYPCLGSVHSIALLCITSNADAPHGLNNLFCVKIRFTSFNSFWVRIQSILYNWLPLKNVFNRTVTGWVSRQVNEEMISFVHLTKQQVLWPYPLNATFSIHTERHLLLDRPDNQIAAATGPIGTFVPNGEYSHSGEPVCWLSMHC